MRNLFKTALLLLLPALLNAQANLTRVLSLDELVQMGLANSKTLKITAAKQAAATAKTSQLTDAYIPTVGLSSSYTRVSENIPEFGFTLPDGTYKVLNPVIPNQYSNRVSLSQVVFTGFRALNAIHANSFLEKAAALDYQKDKAEVQLNLLNAGITLFKLEEAQRAFEANLATARARVTDITNLRTAGMALDNDVLKAELAVSQLETARLETQNALAATRFSLSVMLGLPEDTALKIDSSSVFSGNSDSSLADFLGNVPNLAGVQAAGFRADAANKQIKITSNSRYPLVNVGANLYTSNPNQRFFPPEDKFHTTWDAGISLSWNLTNLYTSRHGVDESRAVWTQASLAKEQLTDAARTEIAGNYYNWQTSREKIDLAKKAQTQATENQRLVRLRQNQQTASATDLLDADALSLQTGINLITARADERLAWFRLLKSSGKL